ncbi:N-acetylneuraminate synthase [uncultured Winogradskyella sp.]|uniref:N-acetylneuraminate synthase n=1 Tax=uncultured Winogradskyella sp. TaxID=395353 RepID=UPI00262FE5A9|nr:N-acetylneuraminate synthase [uncultured Winogradskyella sp.]
MSKVIIIAEAGVNHNGSLDNAFKLIDAAVDAGVDYVKFQSFKTENLVSKKAKKANYQVKNTANDNESQFQMLKKLELSVEDHEQLIAYCKAKGIQFFSTAFDLESLKYLKDIGLEIVKIPSGEITNLPYLKKAAKLFSKVIISTGMSTLQDVKAALDVFLSHKIDKRNITILHCNTEYPTPFTDVNLKAMLHIKDSFSVAVGYSDHTLGIEVPTAAVALGASVIEKHFTLDKTMPGPDHAASIDPKELKLMVESIRNIEKAISGSGIKAPTPSETKNIKIARKSIHCTRDLKKGHVIMDIDITALRPGDGISPMDWDEVVGKTLNKGVKKFDKLKWSDFI